MFKSYSTVNKILLTVHYVLWVDHDLKGSEIVNSQ